MDMIVLAGHEEIVNVQYMTRDGDVSEICDDRRNTCHYMDTDSE